MQKNIRGTRKSPIIIGEADHERLSMLADAAASRHADLIEVLGHELDRARVVPDKRVPATVIRMGSAIVWKTESGEEHHATLVFPGEADIANGKVSILTPGGVALIGLSVGQQMEWKARDGRRHSLTVLRVETGEG